MKRRSVAVLHLRGSKDFQAVYNLLVRVRDEMAAHSEAFPNPDPALAELDACIGRLGRLISEAAGGSHQAVQERNEEAEFGLGLLRIERDYVNKVADGDRATILLSGFDASDEPNPLPAPQTVIVRRAENGTMPNSAKLFIEADGNVSMYSVQMSSTPADESSWRLVKETTNSRNLVIEGLERGKEVFFRISAVNSGGRSNWSDPFSFILQ